MSGRAVTTWHEYALGLFLILAALEGVIYIQHGDVVGAIGIILIPVIFWIWFYWQHYWRSKPSRPS